MGTVGKIVGRGDELVAAVLLEKLGDPIAAAAAADQSQGDLGIRLRAAHQLRLRIVSPTAVARPGNRAGCNRRKASGPWK